MRLDMVPGCEIGRGSLAQVDDFMRHAGLQADALPIYRDALIDSDGRSLLGSTPSAMQSDYHYRLPARQIAGLAADAGLNANRYEFEWRSPLFAGQFGAAHGMELPFTLRTRTRRLTTISGGPQAPDALVARMHASRVAFAKTGESGWPPRASPTRRIMRFDELPRKDVDCPDARMRCRHGVV